MFYVMCSSSQCSALWVYSRGYCPPRLRTVVSVQGLATGWMVRASNPGGGEISRNRPDRPWGPLGSLYNRYRVSFTGVKRPGHDVNHQPPSSVEVKERVELYFYSPSGFSWPALRWTLLGWTLLVSVRERWGTVQWEERQECAVTRNVRVFHIRHKVKSLDFYLLHMQS